MDKKITDYISQARSAGISEDDIRINLQNAGWDAADIETGLTKKQFSIQGKKKFIIAFLAVVLILIAVFSSWPYAMAYLFPAKVWQRLANQTGLEPFWSHITISVAGKGQQPYSGAINALVYADNSPKSSAQISANVSYDYSSANSHASGSLEFLLVNKVFFVNFGDNAYVKQFLQALDPSASSDWLKLDFEKLGQQLQSESSSTTLSTVSVVDNFSLPNIAELQRSGSITMVKVLGIDTVSGKKTLHVQNSFDKEKLKKVLTEFYGKKLDEEKALPEQKQELLQNLNSRIDEQKLDAFETWIGLSDGRLYKVHLQMSQPDSAMMTFEDTISDYGKKQTVTAPANAIDVAQLLYENYSNAKTVH